MSVAAGREDSARQERRDSIISRRLLRMSEDDLRVALIRAIQERDDLTAARDEAQAELQAIKDAALQAGAIAVVQERLDTGNRIIVSMGRSDAVIGMADPSLEVQPGDLVQTDIGRAMAVLSLGSGKRLASDTGELVSLSDDGKATVRINGRERVFALSHELRNGGGHDLKPGDVLLVNEETRMAYAVHTSTKCSNYTGRIPELVYVPNPYLEARIENKIIRPLLGDAKRRKAGACSILLGPAGSGKSQAIKALCQKYNIILVRITPEMVSSSYISETSHAIEEQFTLAIKEAAGRPVLVLIEEANAITGTRYGYHHRSAATSEFANVTTCVLLQIDRLVDLGPEVPVAVAMTSNASEEMDPAIRSRCHEVTIGFISRDFGRAILVAHLEAAEIQLSGGDRHLDRLVDMMFDPATPMVQVDAEIGQTREKLRLAPGQLMLPRLLSNVVGDLKEIGSPVGWKDAVQACHGRLLAHARQVADNPGHYVSYTDHPFAGDPNLKIGRAVSAYPADIPREMLFD